MASKSMSYSIDIDDIVKFKVGTDDIQEGEVQIIEMKCYKHNNAEFTQHIE